MPERDHVVLGHVPGDEDQSGRRPVVDGPQPVEYVAHALHRNMLAALERDDAFHPQQVGAAQLDEQSEEALEQVFSRGLVELEMEGVDAAVVVRHRGKNPVCP